ncbi:MAG TPA: type II secretion system protein [Candidatus Paceibacterota bacterium]
MKNRGLTLIELLVVIAVIGILASVVMASLNSARVKARDTRRLADMKQIQTALEFYYDTYGAYPPITENECVGTEGYTVVNNNFMQSLVTNNLLPTYPVDPLGTNCGMQYATTVDRQGYVVFVHFEGKPNTGCNSNAPYWSCFGVNMNPAW